MNTRTNIAIHTRIYHQSKVIAAMRGQEVRGALSDELMKLITNQATDSRPEADVIEAMGTAAGISASTVHQILRDEIECPPIARLTGFAKALGVSVGALTAAAERDGCDYGNGDEEKSLRCHCNKRG